MCEYYLIVSDLFTLVLANYTSSSCLSCPFLDIRIRSLCAMCVRRGRWRVGRILTRSTLCVCSFVSLLVLAQLFAMPNMSWMVAEEVDLYTVALVVVGFGVGFHGEVESGS
jgi:hypothetical protein